MPGPRDTPPGSLFRRVLLAVCTLVAATLLPAATQAQTPPDIPEPGDTVHVIQLEDPGRTQLFLTSTGRTLRRGELQVGVHTIPIHWSVMPSAAVGLTDRVTITLGAPVILGTPAAFFVAPQVQIIRRPAVQASLGALAFYRDDDLIGVAYGVGTFGNDDRALSAGLGYLYTGSGDDLNEPTLSLGGEWRVGRRIKLITENHVAPYLAEAWLLGGMRLMGDRLHGELALFGTLGDSYCCVPIVNLSYSFGR